MMAEKKRQSLGRGLDALLGEETKESVPTGSRDPGKFPSNGYTPAATNPVIPSMKS